MGAIVHEEKLRTARRMSHVFVIDAPPYPSDSLGSRRELLRNTVRKWPE
jgi:hypothetical protein